MNPDQTSLFDDVEVKSITITNDKNETLAIIGEVPENNDVFPNVDECIDSPDKHHHIDPADGVCLYCGKGES